MKIQTVNHFAHIVYDLEFLNGKLIGIRIWNLNTLKDISRVKRNFHIFEEAIATLCHDKNIGEEELKKLYEAMFADKECLVRTKKIMDRELMYMSRQVHRITLWRYKK